MSHTRLLTVLALIALIAAGGTAAAAETTLDASVDRDLATGNATVTITNGTAPVENATVSVTTDAAYDGNGTYETDANGTVDLPAPSESVTVNVTATHGGQETTKEVELRTRQDAFDADLDQTENGSVSVAVTLYGDAIENATVNVSADGSYADNGTHETDANGTVSLAQPEKTRNVTVEASYDGLVAEETEQLDGAVPPLDVSVDQESDGVVVEVVRGDAGVENATVDVSADGNYSGEGTYEPDDGTLNLPFPSENVTLTVTAEHDGETATASADLTTAFVDESKNFGQAVNRFLRALQTGNFGDVMGRVVSDFATQNNPGNADDAPGREGDAKAPGKAKKDADSRKTAGNGDGKRGPPDHAKGNSDRGGDAHGRSDDSDGGSAKGDDGDRGGSPDRAGGNNGKGKGR